MRGTESDYKLLHSALIVCAFAISKVTPVWLMASCPSRTFGSSWEVHRRRHFYFLAHDIATLAAEFWTKIKILLA